MSQYQPDAVIVNGENSARGNGIDEYAYEQIISAGADVVTGGNHSFQKKTAGALHEEKKRLIRPANMPDNMAGRGELILDFCRFRLRVINLSGSLCMSECINPFELLLNYLGANNALNALNALDALDALDAPIFSHF